MNNFPRIFKTAWFSKAARKAEIDDTALLEVVRQATQGQAVDMGGGVFKKRLNQKNRFNGCWTDWMEIDNGQTLQK